MIADDMSNYDEEGTSLYAILPILLLWAVTRYTYLQNALRDWARHVKSRTQKLKECVDRRALIQTVSGCLRHCQEEESIIDPNSRKRIFHLSSWTKPEVCS